MSKTKEMKMLVYQLLIPLSLYMHVLVHMWDCGCARVCACVHVRMCALAPMRLLVLRRNEMKMLERHSDRVKSPCEKLESYSRHPLKGQPESNHLTNELSN